MNSLFIRIWLAVWAVIVVVVFLSVAVFEFLRSTNAMAGGAPPWALYQTLKDDLTKSVGSGESPKQWLDRVSTASQPVFLIDHEGKDIAGRILPGFYSQIVDQRRRFGERRQRAVIDVDLDGYEPLILLAPRRGGRPELQWFSAEVLIGLGFLLSGIAAIGLARYVTLPIKQLHLASELVARGEFRTNAAAAVGNRRDEVADLARRFDEMAKALASSRQLQQNLLRDVSHELRSPLTRLMLITDLLTKSENEERSRLENRIKKDLVELETLVDEVMILARFDSEAGSLNPTAADIVEALLPVFEDAQFEAVALNKSVEFSYPDEPLYAMIDVTHLKRAVDNVVRNSVRHTPEGTTVRAEVRQKNGEIVLTICDEGDGIDAAELDKIFTPFYRSANARMQFVGAGIGLALVERIVRAHHGCVSAQNTPDAGLLVQIVLPAS